jgi:hypothetical protein
MSKELLKALLDYEFYDKHKHQLPENSFKDANAKCIYQTIVAHHDKHAQSLSVPELKALHYAHNPAITHATKTNLAILFDEIEKIDISAAVGEDLVLAHYKLNQFTELAQMAMDGGDMKEVSIEKMQQVLDNIRTAAMPNSMLQEEYVTDNIDELFDELSREYKWRFLPPLAEAVGGIGEGVFALVSARPNCGKTGTLAALVCQPGGFLAQGAVVHFLGVEEKSVRTKMRAISSYTGMTKEEIMENRGFAAKKWAEVKDRFFLKDVVGMDLTELEEYVKTHKMDILIIDQLDKIKVSGTFSGNHDKYGFLYVSIREMAKKYNIAIIGVCQASNDAEGKLYFGMDALADSKTSKAAELDLCICIGKESFGTNSGERDVGFRMANIAKNKLTGTEESIGFVLDRNLSRITP